MKKNLLCILVFITICASLFSDVPEKKEEVIYSVTLYNGLHYSRTFCREESDIIYLLADTENFLVLKKTLVYYWPLTGKYLADTQKLNIVPDGILEVVKDNTSIKALKTELYIIYNDPGIYRNNWKVFIGKDAEEESIRLEGLMKKYEKEYTEYLTKQKIYETAKEKLIEKMKIYKEQGRNTNRLLNQYKSLIQPVPPLNPTPEELSIGKQFVIDLPQGNYTIRLRNEKGLILQGSEKKLVMFKERRKNIVGYRIVPGNRWTKPDNSHLPSQILYINPTTDIYIIPFLQNEYNDLFYRKMLDNDAKDGNPAFFKWEEVREIPLSHLEITKGDVSISLMPEEFIAEQLNGSTSLGYKIVPYEPERQNKNKQPSFTGFKVPIERTDTSILLKLQDLNGNYFPSSNREIRIVLTSNNYIILIIITVLPLLIMGIVLLIRQTYYKNGEE